MKLLVTQVNLRRLEKYPYTHRVEFFCDIATHLKITDWLAELSVPHTQTGWGVYYLREPHVSHFILKWG